MREHTSLACGTQRLDPSELSVTIASRADGHFDRRVVRAQPCDRRGEHGPPRTVRGARSFQAYGAREVVFVVVRKGTSVIRRGVRRDWKRHGCCEITLSAVTVGHDEVIAGGLRLGRTRGRRRRRHR